MKRLLIIIFLFSSLIVQAQTTYYIDQSGTDGAGVNGSIGTPWATLAYACTRVTTSGDTIHINAGTITETVQSTLAVGVSIKGDGVTSIILSHVNTTEWTSTIYLLSATEGVSGNQTISYIKMDGDNLTAHVAIDVSRRSNVKIHHCTFENFEFFGVKFQGSLTEALPTTWAIGNEFYNNTVTNCSGYIGGFGRGSIGVGGQEGMLIHHNTLNQSTRVAGSNGYCIKFIDEGYNKGNQIYNNDFIREPYTSASNWNFGIEVCQWEQGGLHIYNNTFTDCAIDLGARRKTTYDYAVYIHNNTFQKSERAGADGNNDYAIIFEQDVDIAIVRYNLIKDFPNGIVLQSANATVSDVYIQYNILQQMGTIAGGSVGRGIGVSQGSVSSILHRLYIDNNVIDAYTGGATGRIGINLPSKATATDVYIRNNIIQGFDFTFLSGYETGTLDGLYIQNNILYNNGHTNDPYYENGYLPTNITSTNNIKDNPDFTTPGSDYTLQAGSPARLTGISVNGVTSDFDGHALNDPPDIGAKAYNTSEAPAYLPTVTTDAITLLKSVSVTFNGTSLGPLITGRGFCWSTSINPSLSDSHVHIGTGEGSFSYTASLTSNTTYHVRSFATNAEGTVYGADISFTTRKYSSVTNSIGKIYYMLVGGKKVPLIEK